MKPIVFVTEDMIEAGGIVRVVSNWSNYFIKFIPVEVVSINKGIPYFQLNGNVKWTVVNFSFTKSIRSIFENIYKIYNFLKERKDTNIIFNKAVYIEPLWLLRKLGFFKNINLIYFAHGGSSDFRNFYLSRKVIAHRVKMMFEAFDKVICLYDDEQNYPTQVKQEKLFFISNPLPFEPSCIPFEEKENIVLSLGRVTKEKGIDTLIEAWSILGDKTQDWKLQIVGEGKDKKEFISLAHKLHLNNIEFIDGTTDVKPFYERAKIFVIPSLFEGMPMTILEALACKCVVVSSKTAGGVKLIENNKNGLLFDIEDISELSGRIFDLINNKSFMQGLSKSGYDYIQEYKIEKTAKQWESVLV